MYMNVYEIEERAILQCTEEEAEFGRIDFNAEFTVRGGLGDNM